MKFEPISTSQKITDRMGEFYTGVSSYSAEFHEPSDTLIDNLKLRAYLYP